MHKREIGDLEPKTAVRLGFLLIFALLAFACSRQEPQPTAEEPPAASGDTVPHFDEIVTAAVEGSMDDLIPLIQFSSLPCTKAEGRGGPPKCIGDEAEGTVVEVLPVLTSGGTHIRRSQIANWGGIRGFRFSAAFRNPKTSFTDVNYPAGDYGIGFLMRDRVNHAVFQVTDDGIVRIDFPDPSSYESTLESSEILVTPEP